MGERKELVVWRDPKSYRNERRVCPDSVRAARAATDVAVSSVAAEFGMKESYVYALLKLGELVPGSAPKTVLRRSVDVYRLQHAA